MAKLIIFSDINRINRTTRLEDEEITTIFGDVKIDFTRKPLQPGDHRLQVTTVFGDVKLRFPDYVGIRIEGFTLFGDVEVEDVRTGDEEKTGTDYISENFETAAVRVYLHINTIFADIDIVRVPVAYEPADIPALEDRREYAPYSVEAPYEGETSRLPRNE